MNPLYTAESRPRRKPAPAILRALAPFACAMMYQMDRGDAYAQDHDSRRRRQDRRYSRQLPPKVWLRACQAVQPSGYQVGVSCRRPTPGAARHQPSCWYATTAGSPSLGGICPRNTGRPGSAESSRTGSGQRRQSRPQRKQYPLGIRWLMRRESSSTRR